MTEKFAISLFERLISNSDLQDDRIKYLKCKYALEFLVLNISKILIVYIFALFLGITLEVFVFHLSFMSIRMYAFGAHAYSNFYCTVVTVVLFIGIPLVISHMLIVSKFVLSILFLLNFIIIFKYAPADTVGNQIDDMDQRKLLRNRALKINLSLAIISLLFPSLYFGNLIGTGAFFGSLMLLPLTNNLLNKKN
ncbi:accessory gene regulator B family protein [Bacillus manliponensis]|uniref:accessory gene regulator B family protein n=1 Tax=Bacillus manliponensis TaxID=574376 RepID=UPI003516BD11